MKVNIRKLIDELVVGDKWKDIESVGKLKEICDAYYEIDKRCKVLEDMVDSLVNEALHPTYTRTKMRYIGIKISYEKMILNNPGLIECTEKQHHSYVSSLPPNPNKSIWKNIIRRIVDAMIVWIYKHK